MSHVAYDWVMLHMNESCHICMSHVTYGWVMSHMIESCHIWISPVTNTKESLSYMNESCHKRKFGGNCSECCTAPHTTGWRRLIGSPKLQIIFHNRATKYRALLLKMTYKDKGSYESSPPCTTFTAIPQWMLQCVVQCNIIVRGCRHCSTLQHTSTHCNTLCHSVLRSGTASTISRLLQIIGLFCKRAL